MGGWVKKCRAAHYTDDEINAIARTWAVIEGSDHEDDFERVWKPAWCTVQKKMEAERVKQLCLGEPGVRAVGAVANVMDAQVFEAVAREFTASMVPEERISALVHEADPDAHCGFGMDEFVVLMAALNPTQERSAYLAAERESARVWQRSKMLKQKAMQRWRAVLAVMEAELLRRIVTR